MLVQQYGSWEYATTSFGALEWDIARPLRSSLRAAFSGRFDAASLMGTFNSAGKGYLLRDSLPLGPCLCLPGSSCESVLYPDASTYGASCALLATFEGYGHDNFLPFGAMPFPTFHTTPTRFLFPKGTITLVPGLGGEAFI